VCIVALLINIQNVIFKIKNIDEILTMKSYYVEIYNKEEYAIISSRVTFEKAILKFQDGFRVRFLS